MTKAKTSAAAKKVPPSESSPATAVDKSAAGSANAGANTHPGNEKRNGMTEPSAGESQPAAESPAAANAEKATESPPGGGDEATTTAAPLEVATGDGGVVTADPDSEIQGVVETRVAGWVVECKRARGIWRAGRFWPPVPTAVPGDELTDEQLTALQAEPLLSVVGVE